MFAVGGGHLQLVTSCHQLALLSLNFDRPSGDWFECEQLCSECCAVLGSIKHGDIRRAPASGRRSGERLSLGSIG